MKSRAITTIAALAALTTAAHAGWVTGGDMSMICPSPMAMDAAGKAILNMPHGTDLDKLVESFGCYIVMKGLKFVPAELGPMRGTVEGVIFGPDGDTFHVFINRSGIVEQ